MNNINQTKKDIQTLNKMLNRLNIIGFKFKLYDNKILLVIKRNKKSSNDDLKFFPEFSNWVPFSWSMCNSIKELLINSRQTFNELLDTINEVKQHNSNRYYKGDYLSINDIGINFIKCIQEVSSLEELELKLAIQGF